MRIKLFLLIFFVFFSSGLINGSGAAGSLIRISQGLKNGFFQKTQNFVTLTTSKLENSLSGSLAAMKESAHIEAGTEAEIVRFSKIVSLHAKINMTTGAGGSLSSKIIPLMQKSTPDGHNRLRELAENAIEKKTFFGRLFGRKIIALTESPEHKVQNFLNDIRAVETIKSLDVNPKNPEAMVRLKEALNKNFLNRTTVGVVKNPLFRAQAAQGNGPGLILWGARFDRNRLLEKEGVYKLFFYLKELALLEKQGEVRLNFDTLQLSCRPMVKNQRKAQVSEEESVVETASAQGLDFMPIGQAHRNYAVPKDDRIWGRVQRAAANATISDNEFVQDVEEILRDSLDDALSDEAKQTIANYGFATWLHYQVARCPGLVSLISGLGLGTAPYLVFKAPEGDSATLFYGKKPNALVGDETEDEIYYVAACKAAFYEKIKITPQSEQEEKQLWQAIADFQQRTVPLELAAYKVVVEQLPAMVKQLKILEYMPSRQQVLDYGAEKVSKKLDSLRADLEKWRKAQSTGKSAFEYERIEIEKADRRRRERIYKAELKKSQERLKAELKKREECLKAELTKRQERLSLQIFKIQSEKNNIITRKKALESQRNAQYQLTNWWQGIDEQIDLCNRQLTRVNKELQLLMNADYQLTNWWKGIDKQIDLCNRQLTRVNKKLQLLMNAQGL